ncbi:MAG TPA: hypothetical protein VE800_07780 [Actinomycetota bacterium]|nr:hypothetical protein [Actinomycetota bacterium]
MPKVGGGVRWLTRLDPADEAAYQAAVTPLVGRIERSLGRQVLSTRATIDRRGWALAPWRPARTVWRSTIAAAIAAAPRGSTFLVTDVRDCYGSIVPRTIGSLVGPTASAVVALLERLHDAGVCGLPIGPPASAVLANALLARLDAALRSPGVRHVRWVDDVVAWGPRADVLRAMRSLQMAARSIGLELNEAKTFVLDAPDDVRAVARSHAPSPGGKRPPAIIAAPCGPCTEPRAS